MGVIAIFGILLYRSWCYNLDNIFYCRKTPSPDIGKVAEDMERATEETMELLEEVEADQSEDNTCGDGDILTENTDYEVDSEPEAAQGTEVMCSVI